MTRHLLAFLSLVGLLSGPARAQSTLDKYLKKSTPSASAVDRQSDPSGASIIFKGPEGYWRLDNTRSTGGFCAVTYYDGTSFAGYVGPTIGNTDAFILFSGPTIPAIQKEKKKKMALTTADGKVQSVLAFHAPNAQAKNSGIILFRLTDIQAAMSDISDVENLNVVMDMKQVFVITWKGGDAARQGMQTCLNKAVAE